MLCAVRRVDRVHHIGVLPVDLLLIHRWGNSSHFAITKMTRVNKMVGSGFFIVGLLFVDVADDAEYAVVFVIAEKGRGFIIWLQLIERKAAIVCFRSAHPPCAGIKVNDHKSVKTGFFATFYDVAFVNLFPLAVFVGS